MPLSETKEAQEWLSLFSGGDRLLAKAFLNRLVLVSASDFETKLTQLIETVGDKLNGKVALFPVKPVRKIYIGEPIRIRRERYNSSGKIGYILTNLERTKPRKYVVAPTVESMRAERIPNIFLIDDVLASGDSVYKYWRDKVSKSIKSWISHKKCNIWVITYAAHTAAILVLAKKIGPLSEDRIHYKMEVTSPPGGWNQGFEGLCLKYGRRTNKPKAALGYGSSRSNLIFQHGCPNNAPSILWAQGPSWKPLFPNRGIPASLQPLFGKDVTDAAVDRLFDAGQSRLALMILDQIESQSLSRRLMNLLMILGFLAKGIKAPNLSKVTLLTETEIGQVLRRCRRAGFIDDNGRISNFGLDLLKRYKTNGRPKSMEPLVIAKNCDMYYPSSFFGCQRKFSGFSDENTSESN
ncbi:phosphoribosyltransferase-like protein [Geomonas sp. Red276]